MSPALRAALAALCAGGAAVCQAQSLEAIMDRPAAPKWEAGLGAEALTIADYPASDEHRTLGFPYPYFVYHGRVFRADAEGSRIRRKLAPNVEIDVSGGGAFANDSSDNQARRGMPDLDFLLELGPSARVSFGDPGAGSGFTVLVPVRGVVSAGDAGVHWRGVVFEPELAYRRVRFLHGPLSLRLSLATEFASREVHDYFYSVDPAYATPARPAYAATSGYLGSTLGSQLTYAASPQLRVFALLRYHSYAGAANRDSPLFRDDDGYTASIGMSWSFLRSAEPAAAE